MPKKQSVREVVARLRAELARAETEVRELTGEVYALRGDRAKVEEDLRRELRDELCDSRLRAERNELRGEVATLQKKNQELLDQITKLESSEKTLQNRLDETNANWQAEVDELEEKIDRVEAIEEVAAEVPLLLDALGMTERGWQLSRERHDAASRVVQ